MRRHLSKGIDVHQSGDSPDSTFALATASLINRPPDLTDIYPNSASKIFVRRLRLFVHWDGKSLKFVGEPFTGATALELNSMAASSATNIWAGGWWDLTPNATLAVHFNGSSWQRVFAGLGQFQPSMGVNGMATTKATDTWAVGCLAGSTSATYNTGILHFTGAWAKLALPSEPGTSSCLAGVAATSTTNAWAVGYYVVPDTATNTNVPHLVLLHWDGKAWKAVAL